MIGLSHIFHILQVIPGTIPFDYMEKRLQDRYRTKVDRRISSKAKFYYYP